MFSHVRHAGTTECSGEGARGLDEALKLTPPGDPRAALDMEPLS